MLYDARQAFETKDKFLLQGCELLISSRSIPEDICGICLLPLPEPAASRQPPAHTARIKEPKRSLCLKYASFALKFCPGPLLKPFYPPLGDL